MNYLQSLLDHLINNGIGKDNIEAWAEDGQLMTASSATEDGFTTEYECLFEMSDVAMPPAFLFALVSDWLQKYSPDRQSDGLEPPLFFSQPLEGGRFDLGLKIKFKEQFNFEPDPHGQWEINGLNYTLTSDFNQAFNVEEGEQLIIFDGHTQDNGLENE